MADKGFQKALVRYKKEYNRHVRLEPHIRPDVHVFVASARLVSSTVKQNSYEKYFNTQTRRNGHYRTNKTEHEYGKIDFVGIQSTTSINRLARAAMRRRPEMKPTSDSNVDSHDQPACSNVA